MAFFFFRVGVKYILLILLSSVIWELGYNLGRSDHGFTRDKVINVFSLIST